MSGAHDEVPLSFVVAKQYINSLLELNPAASVLEIRDLVVHFHGDAEKIEGVLKKVGGSVGLAPPL